MATKKNDEYYVKEISETQVKLEELKKEYSIYLNSEHVKPKQATLKEILELSRKAESKKTKEQKVKEAEDSNKLALQVNKK
tara:strand:+ start:422 stop:664 length:243 start_codon:yes stop_codon:yes gene_type:complete